MWDPNICLQDAFFFSAPLSLSLSEERGTLVGFHGGSTTEWVWLHRTNLWALWHYTAQPWGQRKALSSLAQRSDFSLAPWEQRRIMNSRAPGITFGFTRVNSILRRNKGAVGETFVGREQCAQGMARRVSLTHFKHYNGDTVRLEGDCSSQMHVQSLPHSRIWGLWRLWWTCRPNPGCKSQKRWWTWHSTRQSRCCFYSFFRGLVFILHDAA